jgi:hypothetical protein
MAQAVSQSEASNHAHPVPISGQSMWDLWWTKSHWDRVFSKYFGFPIILIPPMPYIRFSITNATQQQQLTVTLNNTREKHTLLLKSSRINSPAGHGSCPGHAVPTSCSFPCNMYTSEGENCGYHDGAWPHLQWLKVNNFKTAHHYGRTVIIREGLTDGHSLLPNNCTIHNKCKFILHC